MFSSFGAWADGKWPQLLSISLCVTLAFISLAFGALPSATPLGAALPGDKVHLGVATCAGTTCHGRTEADGKIVRQDEILRWQEPSSSTGAHSRAFAVLSTARSAAIAQRLGLGPATAAPQCLGCHSEPAPGRGPRFQQSDGVGCEACHGGSTGWIEVHKTGNHRASLSAGMVALENPAVRASICLDCHFGSSDGGQFVSHRMMAAGHPRISFELDLFTTLQAHHDEDADYARRKGRSNGTRVWAIGQAMALDRALSLFANPALGAEGAFPEFYFLDCHSCHRRIYDSQVFRQTASDNPARPIPVGMPPFNDENMIMLSAAARIAAPEQAARFETESKAFHAAFARDRSSAVAAAARLRTRANALADAFRNASFGRDQSFAMIDLIASEAINPRFTDYQGSVQAVMAVDTLLNALVNGGGVPAASAASIRVDINRAYSAVRDPNDFRPAEFRKALGGAVRTVRTLR